MSLDVDDLFAFDVAPLELVLRGSAVYWFLFLAFRFVVRRNSGSLGTADLLLVVLIADAASNAMTGSYHSLAEGAVLLATLLGWDWLLDWAGVRSTLIHRLAQAQPVALVSDGKVLWRNLRRELLTLDDLMSQLRQDGIDDLGKVKGAWIESDGNISVVKKEDGGGGDGDGAGADDGGKKRKGGLQRG
jgi:uncharacterized membrane protein YcaP (DUF421 family)